MSNKEGMYVFVFGAGASKAEEAPTTSELLYSSLKTIQNDARVEEVADFLKDFFFIDLEDLDKATPPTFEEMLTLIDTCLLKREDISKKWNYNKLTGLRNNMVYCVATILDQSLRHAGSLHSNFVDSLFENPSRNNKNTAFISLNYDILLDNALLHLYVSKDWDIDYEIDFRNQVEPKKTKSAKERRHLFQRRDWWHRAREGRTFYLLKLHGSLNWVYCPNCNTIKLTKREKGVLKVWTRLATCEIDHSLQRALIEPPSWQKIYENPHLVRIWLRTEDVLRKASKVFFIGYSLPDSDVRVKYLFKKFLYREDSRQPQILAVLKDDSSLEEVQRYTRLFGKNVSFYKKGFQNFVGEMDQHI